MIVMFYSHIWDGCLKFVLLFALGIPLIAILGSSNANLAELAAVLQALEVVGPRRKRMLV